MKANHKDKSLAKKVLLSVVAAGVMSGFVLTAEAADIVHEDGQKHTYTAVEAGKVTAQKGSEIELNGGKITSIKEAHVDPDDDGVGYADVSAESGGAGSKIVANNADFYGEVHASTGGTIILNGGSVTSGTFYDKDGNSIKGYSTEIGSRGKGAYVKLNRVKIDSNLGAFEGAELTVNDSNVNADKAIYAEGGTINLISTDGNVKYNVGSEGVQAADGGVINIKGGGTFASNSYERCLAVQAFDGSVINVDSGKNKTTIDGLVKLFGSQMNVTGDVVVGYNGIDVEESLDPNAAVGSTLKVNENSKLTTIGVGVHGKGSSFIADGSVEAQHLDVYSNASVILNGGGKITGYKYDYGNTVAASVTGNSTLTATNVDFTGDFKAQSGSKIILKGGSVTASDYYDKDGKKDGYTEFGAVGANSSVEADGVDIKSATLATDGAKVNIKNSSINTVEGIWAWGKGSEIVLDGTAANVYTVGESIVANDGGKIYINGGTLKDNNLWSKMFDIEADGKTINTDTQGIVLDQNGVISTMSKQIYANAATEKESGEIINKGIYFKGGSLILNDAKFTQSYTDSAQAELAKQGVTKLTMNGELVKEETGEVIPEISVGDAADKFGSNTELDKVTAKADGNLLIGSTDALENNTADGVKVQQQVENGFSVGKLDLGAGSGGVVITNNKEVTLGGSQGGSVITVDGADVDVKIVVGTVAPVAGASEINGTLNIGNNNANENTSYKLHGDVEVNAGSSLNVKGQTEITKSLSLNKADVNVNKGLLQTKELNVNEKANLLGAVNATNLNAAGATLAIGNKDGAGKLTVEKAHLNGGMVFLDPAWEVSTGIENASGLAVTDVTSGLNGAYVAGQNSKLSFGANLAAADAAFARSGETWSKTGVTAGAYIASTVDVTHGSITVNGSLEAAPAASAAPAGSVKFADNSMLMVNANAIRNGQVAITGVTAAEISAKSKLYLDNAEKNKTYKIIDGVAANWKVDNILSNNKLLKFEVDAANNSVKTISQSVKAAYGDAVVAGDVYDAAVLAGGAAADFVAKAADEHVNANTATQVSAFNSAAAMGELAGVEHGTYAASNLFTDAISEHMSLTNEKEHDSDIWAKYIHSKENVDGLAVAGADSKYDVNYNGIVVGADLYKNGKATVGAALSYVDGSVKGNTLAARTENDATYYGASIYGGIQNEDSAVIGDISYLHGKNDITQHNSGMTLTADAKSDAFSIGVRAEKTLKAGVGKFVPYAGIRYMHLGTGNYNNSLGMSYDGDDMNLWLLPVGVKYSADVKAGGWTIRPIAEIGYVWNMGDRDATQTVSLNGTSNGFGYDVADNGSYIGRFVVEAEKANVTYGLGYEYQKGDSVKANKWMANVNWSF